MSSLSETSLSALSPTKGEVHTLHYSLLKEEEIFSAHLIAEESYSLLAAGLPALPLKQVLLYSLLSQPSDELVP